MPFRAAFDIGDAQSTLTNIITGTIPAGVQAGDVLLITAWCNSTSRTLTPSGGGTGVTWTLLQGPNDNSGVIRSYLWSATATASSAGSTVTVDAVTGSLRMTGSGLALSGVLESGIVSALTTDSTADTSVIFPSV